MSEVLAAGGAARDDAANERYYLASQWQLIRRKFARHKLAKAGLVVLAVLYVVSMFAEFFATQDIAKRDTGHIYAPPQRIRFVSEEGFSLRPFVYPLRLEVDREKFRKVYHLETAQPNHLRLFTRGDEVPPVEPVSRRPASVRGGPGNAVPARHRQVRPRHVLARPVRSAYVALHRPDRAWR